MKWFRKANTYLEVKDKDLTIVQTKQGEVIWQQEFKQQEEIAAGFEQLPEEVNELTILIGADNLFIRSLKLPRGVKNRLKEVIEFEVLTELPYDKKELYVAYYVLTEGEEIRVFVFAAVKDVINQVYQKVSATGLTVDAIIPASIVTYFFHHKQFINDKISWQENDSLVVSTDSGNYNLTFFRENEPLYMRGGKMRNELVEEMKNTLSHLEAEYATTKPLVIINDEQKNLTDIEQLNFGQLITTKTKAEKLFWQQAKLEIDKLEGQDFLATLAQHQGKKKQDSYKTIALLMVLILLVNSLWFIFNYRNKQEELALLKEQVSRTEPLAKKVLNLQEEYEAIINHKQLLEAELKINYGYLPWLKELSLILSDEVMLEQLIFREDELALLSGRADSATEVMRRLEGSNYFNNLYFIGSIVSEAEGERFRIAGDLADEIN